MCSSPAPFQNMMDDTFSDLIAQGFCMVYMDNILIHVENKEDLETYTKLVLQRLQENNMYLKLKKCKFAKEKIKYLGMIISHNSIAIDPVKLKGIKDWPTPTTTSPIILRIWKLLQEIHMKICTFSLTLKQPAEEGHKI